MESKPRVLVWPREPVVVPLRRQALPVDRREWPSNVRALRAMRHPAPVPQAPWEGPLGPPAA